MLFNARGFKNRQKTYWDAASSLYDESFTALLAPATEIMVAEARLALKNRVFNPACGTGNEALVAARQVGPGGHVLGVDISPGMIQVAAEKMKRHGLENVRFVAGDAEKLSEPSASFDAVICQAGLMYIPDTNAALRDWYRMLRPGGRIALGVMGRLENSSLFLLPVRTYAAHLPNGVVNDIGPNPFQFAPEGVLEAALRKAGFTNVWSKRYMAMIAMRDPEQVWDIFVKGSAGFSWRFNQETEQTRQRVSTEVRAALRAHGAAEGIRLGIELVSAGGSKPREGGALDAEQSVRSYADSVASAQSRGASVDANDVAAFVQGGHLIDVRQPEDFLSGHILGARNIPRGSLEEQIAELAPDTRTPILCCCEDGGRSSLAVQTLSELGYLRAARLAGGLITWRAQRTLVSGGAET